MTSWLPILTDVIFKVISPMNGGFIILLNIMEIAFIVYTGLAKKISYIPYLVSLSLSDLITGATIFLARVCWSMEEKTGSKLLLTIGDYLSEVIIEIPLIVSVSTFTMLTIDRLLAVKNPFVYRNLTQKRRIIICLAIWVLAISLNMTHNYQSYFVAFVALAGIPFPITGYLLIRRALKKSQAMGGNGEAREANKSERRLLSLCFKTFVAYLVCWIPYLILMCFDHFQVLSEKYASLMNYVVFILIFINSSVNPLIFLHHFGVHRIINNHFVNIFAY